MGYVIGRLVVIRLLLPGYFQGQIFTAYEVLHRRFGGATKQVASALFIVTRTLADGLRLFLTAIVLQEVAGIPMNQAIVVIGAATIVYTFLGGMRAVLWTDLIQFFVYVAGAGIAFAVLMTKIDGGFGGFVEAGSAAGKFHVWELGFDLTSPYILWAGLIGGGVLSVASHGVDQMMVQRYLCARSQRQAGLALGMSGVVVLLQFAFFLVIGAALYVYYAQQTPVPSFEGDRVFAAFIVDAMPVGVLGIVLGAVFSAAMSTLSSSLNSSATALWSDIYQPMIRGESSEGQKLRVLRRFTLLFGVAQILVAIAGKDLEGSVVNAVLAIAGFTTGLILGVFLLGLFVRRAGQREALIGLLGGLGLVTAVRFGTDLAWPWYGILGSGTVLILGWLASAVLPESDHE
jgi:SSS family transporter